MNDEYVLSLVNNSSIYGVITLYALKESYNSNKDLNLRKLANLVNGNVNYFEGFINPLQVLDLVRLKELTRGSFRVRIDYLDERIVDNINISIEHILDSNKGNNFVINEVTKVIKFFKSK